MRIGNQAGAPLFCKQCYEYTVSEIWNTELYYNHFYPSLRANSPAAGRKRKENLQLRLWNLNICIEKVDGKCWLAQSSLVMTSLPLVRVFQCSFTFVLVSASSSLAEIWQLSWRGATREMEVEFKFQRRRCKRSFLFPPRRQSASESLLVGHFYRWVYK